MLRDALQWQTATFCTQLPRALKVADMTNKDTAESRVATNLRTLLILEEVARSAEPLSPTEINKAIGLPKQSIHRLCQTLTDEGFLIRDESGRKLLAAPRTTAMAQGLLSSRHYGAARHQVLLALSNATRETVNFAVPESDGMTYLDRVETDWIFRIELPIGSRVPFNCTASGKCFLASLSDDRLNRLLKTMPFEARTPNTITSADALRKELDGVRANGYSIDNEELFEGMVALAVPVHNKQGEYFASVAFHGPTQRLNTSSMLDHLALMRDGARKLADIAT